MGHRDKGKTPTGMHTWIWRRYAAVGVSTADMFILLTDS